MRLRFTVAATFVCVLSLQAQQPVTGIPPFGSFSGGPDVINNANLNVHWTIPIYSRSGRGTPFSYQLTYDSLLWSIVTVNGAKTWQPAANWGWSVVTQPQVGYLTYSTQTVTQTCVIDYPQTITVTYTMWTNFTYFDAFGTEHPMGGAASSASARCGGVGTNTNVAQDGSGYTLTGTDKSGATVPPVTLSTRSGVVITPSLAGGTQSAFTDTNGNEITSATQNGTTTYYDTQSSSTPALTVTGQGNASSAFVFSYPNPNGGNSSYTMKFRSYPIKTSFGCSGIADYSGTQSLVSEIDLPDTTKYTFTYEATPNDSSGDVTGRLASITLPSGGTISYGYLSSPTYANYVSCQTGNPLAMDRTTPDGVVHYGHGEYSSVSSVTSIYNSPQTQTAQIKFQGIYPTQVQNFQGSLSGTLLQETDNCYNGDPNQNCTGDSVSEPITAVRARNTVYNPSNSSQYVESQVTSSYNTYGLPVEVDEQDYGWGTPAGIVRKTLTQYASLGNIVDHPSSVQVTDGSGNQYSLTNYSYDEYGLQSTTGTPQHVSVSGSRGNLTSVSSGGLTQHYHYYDTGLVYQYTDTNAAVTTYTYGTCGNSFLTQAQYPLGLTASSAWNCSGGVQTSATDANGQTTSTGYGDANFWRPTSTTDARNVMTSIAYPASQNSVESTLTFNNGNSTVDVLTTLDGLGRTKFVQQKQAPSATAYDSVETDYDSLGRPLRTTAPYTGTTGQLYPGSSSLPNPSNASTTYDPLNRPSTVTDSGGGTTTYSYSLNDVLIAVGPAPSGENLKQRQLEYNALGQLTSVCEITSAAGSASCGQNTAATGYLTAYQYDLGGNLTQVKQYANGSTPQTRTYSYDSLGRLLSETNPEAGTTTYHYDTAQSPCSNASAGDLIAKTDAAANTTCYTYDAMHRITAITYGTTASGFVAAPFKYYVYDSASLNGTAMANGKGQLVEAYTLNAGSGPKQTDLFISYTVRGEIANEWESTPTSGGYLQIGQSYWENGLVYGMSTNGVSGAPILTYFPDPEGRLGWAYPYQAPSPMSTITNSPFGVSQVALGTGDTDTFNYDPNTGRMTSFKFQIGSSNYTGSLTWNKNGTLQNYTISDPFTSGNSRNCTNAYDDLVRLTSNNCGSAWSQSFSYDVFGNISKSGSISFTPTYNAATNRFQTVPGGTPSYDPDGNIKADGFHSYVWNADGNSTSVDGAITLVYDALGRMVEKDQGGSATEFLYFPGLGYPVMAVQNGTFVSGSYPVGGNVFASYNAANSPPYGYRHPDWLGSTRLITGTSHNELYDYAPAPFGENAGSFFTVNGERLRANDMEDFPARSVHTTAGRWISPDPLGIGAVDPTNPQTWNRYAYVSNNPLGLVDPMGLDSDPTHSTSCGLWCHLGSIASFIQSWFTTNGSSPVYYGFDDMQMAAFQANAANAGGNPKGSPGSLAGGGGGGGAGNPTPRPPTPAPPKNGTGQTFDACMAAHANDFSIAGALNHTYNAITGSNSLAFQNNFFAQAVLGNPITTLAYGSATDNAGTAASLAPTIVQMGMGTVTSYGRRTTTIMALNLAGKGGVPLALGAASAGTKAAIGRVANVAGGFMSLEVSLAVNVGFTAAEAAYCASQP